MSISSAISRPFVDEQVRIPSGIILLAFSFLIGLIPIFYGAFGDEGDKIAIGALIRSGSVLYRDLFSHHFPFAYYWTAAALAIGGHSILAVRLSVWLAQLVTFLVLVRWTRAYMGVGLIALAWNIIKVLFYGHMALYNTFAGIALLPLLVAALCVLTDRGYLGKYAWYLVGMYSAIAILSDPLAVLPLVVVYGMLLSKRSCWSAVWHAGLTCCVFVGLAGALLAAAGALDDFYRDAIRFNTEIYNTYYNMRPERLDFLGWLLRTGLHIAEPAMWGSVLLGFQTVAPFDTWFLGGFALRCAFLCAVTSLLLQRSYRAAVLVYLFAVAVLFRSEIFLRAIPFVLSGVTILGLTVTWLWPQRDTPTNRWWHRVGDQSARVIASGAALVLMLFIWRGSVILVQHADQMDYARHFGVYTAFSKQLDQRFCDRDGYLAYYPSDPFVYFFSRTKPLNRYIFFYPWVAEVGTDEVLHSLEAGKQRDVIVQIDQKGSIWGYPNASYMQPLISYLDQHYIALDATTFRSPALHNTCSIQSADQRTASP
jgi:hypothetical protein